MSESAPPLYADMVGLVSGLPRHQDPERRDFTWVVDGALGVARDTDDRVEIYLTGYQIRPRSMAVARNSHPQPIYRPGETVALDTLCVSLPELPHFDQFAAFLLSELVRLGVEEDVYGAFRQTEPLIEMAFARNRATPSALTAFTANLLVFRAALRQASRSQMPAVVRSWTRSAPWRDISAGTEGMIIRGVEGKTSVHRVNNLSEVSLSSEENHLWLLSIGLHWDPSDASPRETVWSITRDMELMIRSVDQQTWSFMQEWLETFRVSDTFSYIHDEAADNPLFNRHFAVTFNRIFSLDDGEGLLTRADMTRRRFVVPGSVGYDVELPPTQDDPDIAAIEAAARIIIDQV